VRTGFISSYSRRKKRGRKRFLLIVGMESDTMTPRTTWRLIIDRPNTYQEDRGPSSRRHRGQLQGEEEEVFPGVTKVDFMFSINVDCTDYRRNIDYDYDFGVTNVDSSNLHRSIGPSRESGGGLVQHSNTCIRVKEPDCTGVTVEMNHEQL
jgi:hypothetical protein